MSDRESIRRSRVPISRGDNPVVYAQRLYIQFLQGLFNFNERGCLHWEPDRERTEVHIRGEAPLDLQVLNKRPAITVVMGPVTYQGIGLDQMQQMSIATERRRRTDMMSGHLVVYCLAESDVIAQWMAHLVMHGTRVNQRLLESAGGFHQIARPAPSSNPPSPPGGLVMGDPTGLVMVQVNVPFQLQWSWAQTPTAPSDERGLDMITSKRRASDFPYTSRPGLEQVELAMSTSPVQVRRFNSGGSVTTINIDDGQDNYQSVVASSHLEESQEP